MDGLPFGAPPILLDMKSEIQNYLENPQLLPIHDLEVVQQYWKHDTNIKQLCQAEVAATPTTLLVERDINTGALAEVVEIVTPHAGMTNKTSMSLQRIPGPPSEWVRGNASNVPFWPGGLEWNPSETMSDLLQIDDLMEELCFKKDLKTVPPGFKNGMNFGTSDVNLNLAASLKQKAKPHDTEDKLKTESDSSSVIDLADLLKEKGSIFKWIEEEPVPFQNHKLAEKKSIVMSENEDGDLDDIPVVDISKVLSLSEKQKLKSTDWAEIIDVSTSLDNFNDLVPNPAFTWPFELDRFQKHAIIHLEKGEDVFIAAHTSAGKTVVAEYAIALSQKHLTRAIYTSPIKALSNQKFRDFKTTFTDVGLLTGDVQINAKATCLIMTTEILRSMLYNGSDIIRDLEWVIFDEVHYINDSERGVVWEEVLILLPSHVNIVMLSATVPNTSEFATWVGRTKGRKMYVISTLKRPVPLEHYLYTGLTGKTKDERFLIVNAEGAFVPKGYMAAMEAKKSKEKDVKPSSAGAGRGRGAPTKEVSRAPGGGGHKGWGPPQEKNLMIALLDHLKKHDQLPVVAFTFSRNRCDQNSSLLTSVDLVTAEERGRIHQFFQKCVSRLKGSDQKLPQVTNMQILLKRGIGVHHSGILPILKEVVEMLFQEGLVKLLFATETFAMGVNMPARTVVFDSIRKHDGTGFRNLLPAEYIQMAGRAGRRGLDTTGTVIILCKNDVPESSELHAMMLGQPMKLSSQFRVTYSMILNLLRVEHLRVEDMMKRSFGEDHQQSKLGKVKDQLQKLYDQVQQLPQLACDICIDIESYYNNAASYLNSKEEMQESLLTHPSMMREMNPGRVLIVQHQGRCNKLAVLLSIDSRSKEKLYKVLVLISGDGEPTSKNDDMIWTKMLGISQLKKGLFYPTSRVNHAVVLLKAKQIWEVTRVQLKIESDKIVADWDNRQIPRFRDNPPGPSCTAAVQELSRLSQTASVEVINPLQDWKWTNMDLVGKMQELSILFNRLASATCTACSQFEQHLEQTSASMSIQEELQRTQFLLSEDSLLHSADYHSRLEVLKELNYVDGNGTLQMKGKVACEMGNHELIITELVFHNVLTELQPAEIAALLSCLVFQQKNASEPHLTPVLEKGRLRIREIAEKIGRTQQACGIKEAVGDFVDQFRFELVEVVYEWAKGMPFAEIMGLTDVQEGMIVRCIQRLDETLRDVRDAARIIGDPILYQKMGEASTAIKRDIVFAASLYTQ